MGKLTAKERANQIRDLLKKVDEYNNELVKAGYETGFGLNNREHFFWCKKTTEERL